MPLPFPLSLNLKLTLLCGLPLALSACNLADGLSDVGNSLGNPDASLLDAPGRKLASGKFYSLLVDGSFDEGGKVIALEDLGEGSSRLAIIPYPDGKACYIEPATSFDRLSSKISVELPGVFSVQQDRDDNGRGKVLFSDFSCNEVFEPLENATKPRISFPAISPRGLLALDGDGELSLIDPTEDARTSIASGVDLARSTGNTLWSIEAGKLQVRDESLDKVASLGDEVVEFLPLTGPNMLAAIEDKNGLSVWTGEDTLTQLSATACQPTQWGTDTLAYLDPCESRRLRIYTLGKYLNLDDQEFVTIDGPENIIALSQGLVSWGTELRDSEFTFLTGEKDAISGNLLFASLPSAPEVQDGHIALAPEVLSSDRALISTGILFTGYENNSGDIVELKRDEENKVTGLTPIVSQVRQLPGGTPFSSRGVLREMVDGLGKLVLLEKDSESGEISETLLLENVPRQDQMVEPDTARFTVLADSTDGETGTLYRLDTSGDKVVKKKVAEDVFLDTARFIDQPKGIVYLTKPAGEGYARLQVWLTDSELTLTVHKRVSEYRTVPWPSPGLLYAVPSGDDQGLWYSKAR